MTNGLEKEKKLTAAQRDARLAIVRDVDRSGGEDRWSHLHSHGHHYSQVMACVHAGQLEEIRAYFYRITPLGRQSIDTGGSEV